MRRYELYHDVIGCDMKRHKSGEWVKYKHIDKELTTQADEIERLKNLLGEISQADFETCDCSAHCECDCLCGAWSGDKASKWLENTKDKIKAEVGDE